MSLEASVFFFVNASGSWLKALLRLLVHVFNVSLLIIMGGVVLKILFSLLYVLSFFFLSSLTHFSVFPPVSNGSVR